LSLRLLVDEDTQAKRLVKLLREAGHDVLTVEEAGLGAHPDMQVLEYARRENRIVLTRNCEDFRALHEAGTQHAASAPSTKTAMPPRT
jgi:predicted nuclease of predicted toxin-antitoxin system